MMHGMDEVVIPNVMGKKKLVHVNNCNEWHQSEAMVLRIVVAAEDNGEEPKDKLGLSKENLTDKQLNKLLKNYEDIS